MLDIKLFRDDLEAVIKSEKKRGRDGDNARKVLEFDEKWRAAVRKGDELRQKRNEASKKVALAKDPNEREKLITETKAVNDEIGRNDNDIADFLKKRDEYRYKVGNILLEDVPIGNEEKNQVIRTFGKKPGFDFEPKAHVDLTRDLDLAELDKAAEISGARFYYLKNEMVILHMALIRYALDELMKKGYNVMLTPFMVKRPVIEAAAELADFEQQLYKVDDDMFLIATSEQTLAALHMNEAIQENDLPKVYGGFSTCFRKEAGSHGKDTKGVFRVHQFDKVEQYVFCSPEESGKWFDKMISVSEELMKGLKLHYQVVSIASQEMNDNAAKKYDIEVWMPSQNQYREMVSCSNCTDYQARKLNVRIIMNKGGREILHTLNSTALAMPRLITAILENCQKKDGSVKIPEVLWKYTGFKEMKQKK
ncbi:MAG: serine--tRNA ligase [Candidatus Aenigmarchaeota archaeon]|nr:serine--tRNA ligase [Candidatus Aenigmarchaeota archaeon]